LSIHFSVDQQNAQLTSLGDDLASVSFLLLNERQACEGMKSQIVRSPAKVKKVIGFYLFATLSFTINQALRDSESTLNAKRAEHAEMQASQRRLQTQVATLGKLGRVWNGIDLT